MQVLLNRSARVYLLPAQTEGSELFMLLQSLL